MSKAWMPLFIGDYLGDTSDLTQGQHGAYLLLLMHYWQRGPLPLDIEQCYCIAHAMDMQSRCNVDAVLRDFFIVQDEAYHQSRLDRELEKAQKLYERRSGAANKRWGNAKHMQNKCKSDAKEHALHVHTQCDCDSRSTTNSSNKKTGSRIPESFGVSQEMREWAIIERLPNPDDHIAAFTDYWRAVPGAKGVKLDWDATFRNWLRRVPGYGGSNGAHKPNGTQPSRQVERAFNNILAVATAFGAGNPVPQGNRGSAVEYPRLGDGAGQAARSRPAQPPLLDGEVKRHS